MRRKGEKKLEEPFSELALRSVQHAIERGDSWFGAWQRQAATPYPMITRKTGIPDRRLVEINHGEPVTRDEIEVLATLWRAEPEMIIATIRTASRAAD